MIQHFIVRAGVLIAGCLMIGATGTAMAQAPREASPAAAPIPETLTPQTFAPELIAAGAVRFAADCGFCHGRDTMGGTTGSDLTRSQLVAEDVGGDLIGEAVLTGRVDTGMPAFTTMAADDLAAIVAFIHDQKARAESLEGGRRSVEASDLQTGNARAGRRYFDTHCSSCHSATGDLEGIGARLQGLTLIRRMLYPGSEGRSSAPPPARPTVTVETENGETISGALAYRDEFTIALTDADGRYHSWPTRQVAFDVSDPMQAHVELLAIYTDDDIHDVYAYLESLR